jgi:phosphoribosylformylglycinamidine synthase
VGNVNRDIIAMGAEPAGLLNILRFGDPRQKQIREMVNAVVSALGSYSNNFGVPVVGGEILFESSYQYNPLVNIMGVGWVRYDKLISAAFTDTSQAAVLLGMKTSGRSIHGAGFASKAIVNKGQMVPDAQVADPATGRILMECILELNQKGLIRGMQDIGAGGVFCAAAEMAFRGKKGCELHLDQIPLVREYLDPLGILLSQTQEQMLLAVAEGPGQVWEVASRWEVQCSNIGSVKDEMQIRILDHSVLLGELPVRLLVRGGEAPVYVREMKAREKKPRAVSAEEVPMPGNLKDIARKMVSLPNIASRRWIYEQFDTMAGLANLSSEYASDAGIVKINGYDLALAMSVDGNSRYGKLEPKGDGSVAEAGCLLRREATGTRQLPEFRRSCRSVCLS